jgi:16S rRNA (cytosine967-C5)-methyltransferase
MVNAVLRRIAELREELLPADPARNAGEMPPNLLPLADGRAWLLREPVFDAEPLRRLAQQTSHPEPLIQQWAGRLGLAAARQLALHSIHHAPIIVTGLDASTAASLPLSPHEQRGFFVFRGDHVALASMLDSVAPARVQDPGASDAVRATERLAPGLIIDACAGMGTKTKQLAELHPNAHIIATDIDDARRAILRQVFEHAKGVKVVEPEELARFNNKAELILLDVPCSNTAVLARRVEAKYRVSPQTLASLVDVQRQIIADSIPLLADRAHLLYSTCSLEPMENQEQARWLMHWHRLRMEAESLRMPRGVPGDPDEVYCDGSYYALLAAGA